MEFLRLVAEMIIQDAAHIALVGVVGATLCVVGLVALPREGWSAGVEVVTVSGQILIISAAVALGSAHSPLRAMVGAACLSVAIYAAMRWAVRLSFGGPGHGPGSRRRRGGCTCYECMPLRGRTRLEWLGRP
jgi:hypothetical protein